VLGFHLYMGRRLESVKIVWFNMTVTMASLTRFPLLDGSEIVFNDQFHSGLRRNKTSGARWLVWLHENLISTLLRA
jgi:hypothetical protein